MSEIVRIIIKGASGYGPAEDAYKDKLTLTADSIRYEYTPTLPSEAHGHKKWSYQTTSPRFRQIFEEIAARTPEYLYNLDELFVRDIGPTELRVTFADGHRESANFFCPSEFFREYFLLIKQLVPGTEETPTVLLTRDDFE